MKGFQKNSLPYLKCVLLLSCVVHGPIYGLFNLYIELRENRLHKNPKSGHKSARDIYDVFLFIFIRLSFDYFLGLQSKIWNKPYFLTQCKTILTEKYWCIKKWTSIWVV